MTATVWWKHHPECGSPRRPGQRFQRRREPDRNSGKRADQWRIDAEYKWLVQLHPQQRLYLQVRTLYFLTRPTTETNQFEHRHGEY